MNRAYTAIAAVFLAVAISGCAANGKIASSTNGPVDPQVTFDHTCQGLKLANQGWQAAVTIAAGKISADDIKVEQDAYGLISTICFNADGTTKTVPTDLPGILLTLTADSAPIGQLVAKYSTKPVPPSQ